jgi:predicted dehydrogenase
VTKLKIGIVGCGEVTQIIHIPALRHLSEMFSVVALCDISQEVLDGVAPQCGEARTYLRYQDLLQDENVDAVLVANPHVFHAEVAIAAMEAGKDVFVEKPMCMSLAEADAVAEAETRTGRTIQIGYMRRYAGAFLEAVELARQEKGKIRMARVQDVIGRNALIIEDTSRVVRALPSSEKDRAAFKQLETDRITGAIGECSTELANSYALLLGLSSHDISAMREMLGRPKAVLHATHNWDGRYITAVFDYGDFVCEFATGVDMLPRFDTFIEVYSEEVMFRLDYDTPYVRNLPAKLTVTRPHQSAGVARTESYPSRLDSFVVEWRAFHHNVTTGTRPKTTVADAREDLEIFLDIVSKIRESASV